MEVDNVVRTKTQERIIEAYHRGYKVTVDGLIYGPKGNLSIRLYGKQRYPYFSTNWGGKVYGIPMHQFAAYCFYGEKFFDKSMVVRHLNGNTLDISKDNITLGTYSQNEMDKPRHVRVRSAKAARKAQGVSSCRAKLSDEDVRYIRSQYKTLCGGKAPNGFTKSLCEKFGVSRTVINKVVRGKHYAHLW